MTVVLTVTASLTVVALLLRERLMEEWFLRRLETGDLTATAAAIEELGRLRSLRAVPFLLKALDREDEVIHTAALRASRAIGKPAASVLIKIMACQNPQLRTQAATALTDLGSAEDIATDISNPMLRMQYADALAAKLRNEEALAQMLWCYDQRVEYSLAVPSVRNSLFLEKIGALGIRYPLALEALRTRRDSLEHSILASRNRTTLLDGLLSRSSLIRDAQDFCALNRELKEPERTLRVFDNVKTLRGGSEIRRVLLDGAFDVLFERQRYSDIVDALGQFEDDLQQFIAVASAAHTFTPAAQKIDKAFQELLLERYAKFYGPLLAVGQLEKASALAKQLTKHSPTCELYVALISQALLVNRMDHATRLFDEAAKVLSPTELQMIKGRTSQQPPVSPE